MPTKALSERPLKVTIAVKFFYLVVGLGIIRAVMTIIRHADVRSPHFLIYTKLIIYAGSLYLIYQLNKGRNWARWVLGVIFIIAIPLVILPALASFSHNPVGSARRKYPKSQRGNPQPLNFCSHIFHNTLLNNPAACAVLAGLSF